MARAVSLPALATLTACLGLLAGCETLDALAVAETHRLGDAPYYVNAKAPPPPGSCALVLPVSIDPGLAEQFGYGERLREFEPLRAALDSRLASRSGCIQFAQAAPVAGTQSPRVFVGSSESDYAPAAAAAERLPSDRFAPMVLHLERPDENWARAVAALLQQAQTPYAIAIQVGVSQYQKGYSGVFRKEVVLGTGYRQPIQFLTSEVKPVEVLHLTGVLVDANSQPVRAGAEGVVLRDTPFLAQAIDVSRVFDAVELQNVLVSERRQDLPDAPLKLDVALDNLIAQLTRGAVLVPATP